MKRGLLQFGLMLVTTLAMAQAGHIMQGVGAVNMSMGGASTAQPIDISGAIQWNPASISVFDENILKFDIGVFFATPELSSSFGPFSGTTVDDRASSPMPAVAFLWGKEDSRHTFAASAFGISGFGVTFPEDGNYPQDLQGNPNPEYDPNMPSNPINFPQHAGGFGRIESSYLLLQVGFTYAYELSDKFSIGVQPTFNYSTLELIPNPTANPTQAGYPSAEKATAVGFGAQFGVFFDSGKGIKAGVSYKTEQSLGDFEFDNVYLDNTTGTNNFKMNYPSILSVGLGYSKGKFDVALDYRFVDYENTDGFAASGWTQTASVAGFGWESMSIISAGIQFKGINRLPLRIGYTYSTNPIPNELAFFNVSATAVIENAFQFGLSYEISDQVTIDGLYHYGTSGGATEGQLLNPGYISPDDPLGKVPDSSVSYEMTTSLISVGVSWRLTKK